MKKEWNVKACRPSDMAERTNPDEFDQEVKEMRRGNVARYATQVSAGLAVFSGDPAPPVDPC